MIKHIHFSKNQECNINEDMDMKNIILIVQTFSWPNDDMLKLDYKAEIPFARLNS